MSKFRDEVDENMQALCPHQVDLLERDPVLNVFNSQLCSPTEENLRGRPIIHRHQRHIKYIIDCVFISENFLFWFKVLATPGKLCGGVSMSTNFPGARSHGTPQDTEMDVAWQELMAITELQVTLHQQNTEHCKNQGFYCKIELHASYPR